MSISKLQCGIGSKVHYGASAVQPDPKRNYVNQTGRTKRLAVARTTAIAKAKAAIRRTNLIDADIAALMAEFGLTEGKVRTLIGKIRLERERGLRPHANAAAQ